MSDAMRCPRCGTANPDGDDFCANCGQAVSAGADVPRPKSDTATRDEGVVPDWLLDLQANFPEELRDPDLDHMVRQRSVGSAQVSDPPEIERPEQTSRPETEVTLETDLDDESEAWRDALLSSREPGVSAFDPAGSQASDGIGDSKRSETEITVEQDIVAQPAGEGEMPEWMQQLAEQVQEEPSSPTETAQAGLPDGAEPEQTVPLSHVPPGEAPADASDIPGWLRELRDQDTLEDMEPPAWLTESEEAVRGGMPEGEIPYVQEDTPAWPAGSLPVDEDTTSREVPGWLRDLDTKEQDISREIDESLEGEVPPWLERVREGDSAEDSATPDTEPGQAEAKQHLPEQPTIPEQTPHLPRQGSSPDLAPTQAMGSIPEPESAVTPTASEPLRVLEEGESAIPAAMALALGAEPAITALKPRRALMPPAVPEETENSRIIRDIASQPLMPEVTACERRSNPLWGTLGRVILYSIIIAVVVLTLYWQEGLGIGFISEHNIPVSAQTQNVYERINAVPEQSLALVVVDYEPSLAEELNAQARTLLQSLMRRRFNILVMSTTLTGPQVAQSMMEELAAQARFDYEYGEDYINLGYLPGQETSLLLFGRSPLSAVRVDFRDGQSLGDYPITAALSEVPQKGLGQAIPLIVNLSGSQDNLRTWIEQVLGANENVNMIAGVSAALEPYARPYLDSGQLAGLLSGLIGAAEYEAVTREPGGAIRSVDAQAAVHLVIVGSIVLGNVAYALQRVLGGHQESSGSWKL